MDHDLAVKTRATERYLLGEMSASERDAFEVHFFECAECGNDVTAADQLLENARRVLAREPGSKG